MHTNTYTYTTDISAALPSAALVAVHNTHIYIYIYVYIYTHTHKHTHTHTHTQTDTSKTHVHTQQIFPPHFQVPLSSPSTAGMKVSRRGPKKRVDSTPATPKTEGLCMCVCIYTCMHAYMHVLVWVSGNMQLLRHARPVFMHARLMIRSNPEHMYTHTYSNKYIHT